MILEEFNQEWHEAKLKEESRKEGIREGREQMLLKIIQNQKEQGKSDEDIVQTCGITWDEFYDCLGKLDS